MQREPVYAFEFEGKRYDCGSKLGYLQATVEYGLKHPSLGGDSRVIFATWFRSCPRSCPSGNARAAAGRNFASRTAVRAARIAPPP